MVRLRKKTQLEEISSASMSDVAFLLLVFFMVASVFYVKEGLSSSLPKKDSQPQLQRKRRPAGWPAPSYCRWQLEHAMMRRTGAV